MTNNKQQTAVEWFANEVYQIIENYDVDKMGYHIEKAHKQAKEMEKEQRMSDFTMGITNANRMEATKDAELWYNEKWYNETYGGNK